MLAQEKAEDLYTKFQQYDWDNERGWIPDEVRTKRYINKIIDEIELCEVNFKYIINN